MEDLLREFVGEALDQIEEASADLVAWERDPTDRDALDRIFRAMHTIKGSSSFFELPRTTGVAHAAEEALEALRNRRGIPDGHIILLVLEAFDVCRRLVSGVTPADGEPQLAVDELIKRLGDHVRRDPRHEMEAEPAAMAALAVAADPAASWRTVRVPLDLLDTLMNAVSDLVLSRNELVARLRAERVDIEAMPAFERFNAQLVAVRGIVSGMRMVPLRQIFAPLPRLVRQIAADLGKQVQFVAEGGEVEIDREVGEALRDPLTHLLRNAIDHGVESAQRRREQAKAEVATIRVSALRSNNRISIIIADDGQGIDVARVVAKAVAGSLLTAEAAAALSPQARLDLIFHSGLSTTDAVTNISGRGVGMDVIRANVERIGGRVSLDNAVGKGLTVTLDVPMTLTIVNALAVPVAGQDYAIPRAMVEEVMMMTSDWVQHCQSGGADFARIRGKLIPMLVIEKLFDGDAATDSDDSERALIILRGSGRRRVALSVPDVRDIEELVIKPVPAILASHGLFCGMSLPDSGRPLLVLDIESILMRCPEIVEERHAAEAASAVAVGEPWLFLTRHGSDSRNAVPMAAIDRIVDVPRDAIIHAGGRWFAHMGEDIMAVAADFASLPASGMVRLVKLALGNRTLAIDAADIGHIVQIDPATIRPADQMGVMGISMFGHEMVELIDVHAMLSATGAAVARSTEDQAAPATIWLMSGDEASGALRLLAPLIEQAGYRCKSATEADTIPADADVILRYLDSGADNRIEVRRGTASQTVNLWDRAALLAAIGGERAA